MFCIYVYVGIVLYCFLFLSCPQCFFLFFFALLHPIFWFVLSSQVTFIYIALLTIQMVSKQLLSIMQKDNCKHSIFS